MEMRGNLQGLEGESLEREYPLSLLSVGTFSWGV